MHQRFPTPTPPIFAVDAPGLGWDHLVTDDNFTLAIISGSHQSIFKEPRVQYLAEQLRKSIDDALQYQAIR